MSRIKCTFKHISQANYFRTKCLLPYQSREASRLSEPTQTVSPQYQESHANSHGSPPWCSKLLTNGKCAHRDITKRFLRSRSASDTPHAIPLSICRSTVADIVVLNRRARAGERSVASRIPYVVRQGLRVWLLATERMYGVGINVRGGEAWLFIVEVCR